jgi:hypothetical protein
MVPCRAFTARLLVCPARSLGLLVHYCENTARTPREHRGNTARTSLQRDTQFLSREIGLMKGFIIGEVQAAASQSQTPQHLITLRLSSLHALSQAYFGQRSANARPTLGQHSPNTRPISHSDQNEQISVVKNCKAYTKLFPKRKYGYS